MRNFTIDSVVDYAKRMGFETVFANDTWYIECHAAMYPAVIFTLHEEWRADFKNKSIQMTTEWIVKGDEVLARLTTTEAGNQVVFYNEKSFPRASITSNPKDIKLFNVMLRHMYR